jgi:Flp pilus assembly protein TadD
MAVQGQAEMTSPQTQETLNIEQEFTRRVEAAQAAFNDGRLPEAAKILSELARQFPLHPLPHAHLGVVLRRMGKVEAAVASYWRSLALMPENPNVMSSLGNALRSLNRPAEAEKLQERTLAMSPDDRSLRYNYALTLRDMRKLNESLQILSALHDEHPDDFETVWDLAITQLQMGDYIEGFKGYEARWRLPRNETRMHEGPYWNGEELSGKRILLQSEQGFGDAIQFARYIPLVAERGAHIVLECLPELASLFANIPGVKELVIRGANIPKVDCSIPLLSLPRIFGTTFATIPAQVPYLQARQKLTIPLAPGANLRVGLIWAGKPSPRDRSWPLPLIASLLDNPRISFFSLQTGPRADELVEKGFDHLVADLGPRLADFSTTAAVMNALDLIVTIDTASAHLAGALGRPTFVLLRYVSDWRWQDDREDSPWYPTLRLFRQSNPDDFTGPVERLGEELKRLTDGNASPAATAG